MRNKQPLTGRLAIVTGSSRGVGAGIARELARHGAHVVLLGREEETLARVAASLPVEAHSFGVDVTDDEAMDRVASWIRARFGRPSVAVANAGVAEAGPFDAMSPWTWRRVIEVNLVGSAVTARAFLPDLLTTHGYFLQIASMAAFGPAPMMSAYCASKAGAESFAQCLRAELGHRGGGGGCRLPELDRHGHDPGRRPAHRTAGAAHPYAASGQEDPPGRDGRRAHRDRHRAPLGLHLRAGMATRCPAPATVRARCGRPVVEAGTARHGRTDRAAGLLGSGGLADQRGH